VTAPDVLTIPQLAAESGLLHGFSTTGLGSVGLIHAPDPAPVLASRRAFARELGIVSELTTAGAVHGSKVSRVDEPHEVIQGVDGLVTDKRNVALFATFADCYPIVLWDPEKRAVGLAHAGWRGTHAGVTAATATLMREEYGCRRIRTGIGPGICGRCYEVGPEFAAKFDSRYLTRGSDDKLLLDLAAANRDQLEGAGVQSVYDIGMCTRESYLFPSHRRHPDGTRFGAIVAVR
jgi:YfiH family protein